MNSLPTVAESRRRKTIAWPTAALVLLMAGMPAPAHRLDEYLQGILVSVGHDRLEAQISLTPGMAVLPAVLAEIDTNGDGVISKREQHAYGRRVLGDLSISIDGHRLMPRLLTVKFPAVDEMKEGLGEIRIDLQADLPAGGPERRLTLENRHQSRIAVYQVNCLVPSDPDIRIVAQNRNYTQSVYELVYRQAGVGSSSVSLAWAWWWGDRGWLAGLALMLAARLAWLFRQRRHTILFAHTTKSALD